MLEDAEEKEEGIFWSGALTKLLTDNDINIGHYTQITQKLIAMGCIEQVKRGGGRSQSVWCLITEPTEDLFQASVGASKVGSRLSRQTSRDKAIEALIQRVSKLELVVQRLIEIQKGQGLK